jgi:hypothetical protein
MVTIMLTMVLSMQVTGSRSVELCVGGCWTVVCTS